MSRRRAPLVTLMALLVVLLIVPRPIRTGAVTGASALDVVISEIAWMGTTASSDHEWIELYNNTPGDVDLAGWTLSATDGTPSIALSGTIPAGGYFLLERGNDDSVPGVGADQVYTGALDNDGEELFLSDSSPALIDEVDCPDRWYSGHDRARVPMVRIDTRMPGTGPSNWTYNPRCGTATNSAGAVYPCPYTVAVTSEPLDYALYFNERTTTAGGPTSEPTAMEAALLSLIDGATTTIDVALYELDRQSVVDALIAAHDGGVAVRVVGDDEAAADPAYSSSYQALLDAGIAVISDTNPTKIQHNKFLVLDGSVVWTGSADLTDAGLTLDANSSIAITGTLLAGNYAAEFEEMWAGRFDGDKTVNTIQHLDYHGAEVESYFSPTDWPAFEVWLELAKAEQTIHLAMSSWTDELLSKRVAERIEAGVEVYGVWDQLGAAKEHSQDEMLCLAGARIGIENLPGQVHHQFAVIDVAGDDPAVILGSYDWTMAGAYDNDENMLIVHDRALAQAYYAEWQRLWATVPPDRICNPFVTYLPAVHRQQADQLDNPDFEGEYKQFAHFKMVVVAHGWLPWWTLQGQDDPPWSNRLPEYEPVAPSENWIHSGANAQQLYTSYGTHVAGVYQEVSGIEPGSTVRFSIWGRAWASQNDDPNRSQGGGPMHMRVGIDPRGGTDPHSPGIVWSAEQNPLDVWSPFTVEATALADSVTVFTYSAPEYPTKHNHVYWDDASLSAWPF